MSSWIPRQSYHPTPGERLLIALQYPDWPDPVVRSAQWFGTADAQWLVTDYGRQSDVHITHVMVMPDPPDKERKKCPKIKISLKT